MAPSGSEDTRRFYDDVGWTRSGDDLVDVELFGNTEDGPIRRELHELAWQRVRDAIGGLGAPVSMLELGCGGSSEVELADLCRSYLGIDFSMTGILASRPGVEALEIPGAFVQADACHLPLEDASVDAIYSAHMLYHIPDAAAQGAAVDEMLRVVRPGGVVVLIVANPWPLLFPVRLLRRVVAITPGVSSVANRLRAAPPLPYLPLSRRWFRRRVGDRATMRTYSHGLASTAVNRTVSEFSRTGRARWLAMREIERRAPRVATAAGNYTLITLERPADSGRDGA